MLRFFTFILAFSSLMYANNTFYNSIYNKNFKDIVSFQERDLYSQEDKTYNKTYVFYNSVSLDAKRNFRLFLPNFTRSFEVAISRTSSIGWMDAFVSFGKIPYIPSNLSEKLERPLSTYNDSINKIKYDKFYNNDMINDLTNGWTLRFSDATFVALRGSNKESLFNDYNKWLYYKADNRPSPNGAINRLLLLKIDVTTYLDKNAVDSYVDKNSLCSKTTLCTNYPDGVKKACCYIRSFGDDGDDGDFSTHSRTAKGQIVDPTPIPPAQSIDLKLADGWNFIGSHYKEITSSDLVGKKVAYFDGENWLKLNLDISTKQIISIPKGHGFWIYSDGISNIKLADTNAAQSFSETLKKGWNMLAAVKNFDLNSIQNCIEAIYKFDNGQWKEWSNKTKGFTEIKQNEGFWVKTSTQCPFSY